MFRNQEMDCSGECGELDSSLNSAFLSDTCSTGPIDYSIHSTASILSDSNSEYMNSSNDFSKNSMKIDGKDDPCCSHDRSSSSDNIPSTKNTENLVQILSESLHKVDSDCCKNFVEMTNCKIKESILWPKLVTLDKVFSNSDNEKPDDEILDSLHEKLDENPELFAEYLSTIIEEDFNYSSFSKKCRNWDIDTTDNNSTAYMNLKTPIRNENKQETPIKTDKHKRRSVVSTRAKKMNFGIIPKIVISVETPSTRSNHLPENRNDEDDHYVTAESDIESDEETSKNESLNMSKVVFHHGEWLKAYNNVSHYKPMKISAASISSDSSGKVAKHINRLEKRGLRNLAQKCEKCFTMIKNLIAQATAKREQLNEQSLCACEQCNRQTEFYNTMTGISDYCSQTISKENSLQASKKKTTNFRSTSRASRSPRKETRTPKVQKMVERTLNSSSSRKSPRTPKVQKMVEKLMQKSSSSRKTPRTAKRNQKSRFEIDISATKPVSELRKIYSPVNKDPKCKVPMPKQLVKSTYTSKLVIPSTVHTLHTKQPTTSTYTSKIIIPCNKNVVQENQNSTISSKKVQFKNVKSPVAEYIRTGVFI